MSKDPYRYFRIEARELVESLGRGVLALEKGRTPSETVARLLRDAHTLKGAARVVKQTAIADATHRLETILAAQRDAGRAAGPADVEALLRLVDEITKGITLLEGATTSPAQAGAIVSVTTPRSDGAGGSPAPMSTATPAGGGEAIETVRVEIADLDALLGGISETSVQLGALRRATGALGEVRQQIAALAVTVGERGVVGAEVEAATIAVERLQREIDRFGDRATRELDDVRERAGRLRLVPVEVLFPALERATRDAAHLLGKEVAFTATGGTHRLDGHVLAGVRTALLHVVRNAVDHGIEPAAERATTGKPPVGSVHLVVEQRGDRVVFQCRDDGRGIDVERVRRAAMARGTMPAAELLALGDEQAMRLIFEPGISTAAALTELSGRGVGLDVVRAVAARLKGDVSVASEAGAGAALELSVPVSLLSVTALEVEVGGHVAGIPLAAIRRTMRLRAEDIRASPVGDSIELDDQRVPFAPLDALLGVERQRTGRGHAVVVFAANGEEAAVAVDRVRGTRELFVRPLPVLVGRLPLLDGVCFDADGNPQPMLEPRALVAAARQAVRVESSPPPPRRLPILVIDDSLTSRMLEQSILESAGYEVDVASHAEEALTSARARRYGLFVCDVEMPGMSGFEFVAITRSDPELASIPSILVTSRAAPEDLRRGVEVGASAYMVKGEFDQGRLLELVQNLLGSER